MNPRRFTLLSLSPLILVASALTAPLSHAEVSITMQQAPRIIKTPEYTATVAGDGCLTHLVVEGQEFFASNAGISRGSYFYQGGPLRLRDVKHPAPDVITAKSKKASVRYEFSDKGMTWTLKNATKSPMSFFMVFDPGVTAVRDPQGRMERTVVTAAWRDSTWFHGEGSLQIRGGDKQWGPWNGKYQVWEAALKPGEERRVELSVAKTTDKDRAAIQALTPEPVEAALTLLTPLNYQVFQRATLAEGPIRISGRTRDTADAVEARITGKPLEGKIKEDWFEIPYIPESNSFFLEKSFPSGGWYRLDVRARKGHKVIAEATVEKFGVGEVFVGAGQSNSTNCGQFRTKETTGMVSSFSGEDWRLANDPQPGVADHSTGGSFWPSFGDAMYQRFHVPIAIASTGYGGTSVNQWQPDGELFKWMMTRIYELGPRGFRAVLWHQGESDWGMSTADYYRKLKRVILESKHLARWEFPWFVAQATYHNMQDLENTEIRAAQKKLWDDGVALRGPDTDTLTAAYRDNDGKGIHFSPKGLKVHGEMWADLVGPYVEKALGK